MTPPIQPSGLQRGISFTIPDDWTPEQALAIFELLDDLRQVVADHYMSHIQRLLREQRHYTNCAVDPVVVDEPF